MQGGCTGPQKEDREVSCMQCKHINADAACTHFPAFFLASPPLPWHVACAHVVCMPQAWLLTPPCGHAHALQWGRNTKGHLWHLWHQALKGKQRECLAQARHCEWSCGCCGSWHACVLHLTCPVQDAAANTTYMHLVRPDRADDPAPPTPHPHPHTHTFQVQVSSRLPVSGPGMAHSSSTVGSRVV
jgi:hypothetical protein